MAQQQEVVLTTGVVGGPLVARTEIRTFAKDHDLMDLYILGLDRFQRVDQASPHSWFQIAGIHGRPYVPYAGAKGAGNFGGYCTHSSILFPPWHRPYLALFEQHLAKHVTDIANEYPAESKQRYVAAAQRFRIPYWDWADNADLPDFISRQADITVNSPTGPKKLAQNPLYSYTFRPMYSNFGDGLPDEKVWESWTSTVRWPSATNASARSNAEALEKNLGNNRLTLRDRTYNLLTQATTYEAFSNDGWMGPRSDPRSFDSLESIHGSIHGMCGRNGHMGVVDYAAFDPVFWLHHANCDRLFAMWQALNPNSYVVPKVNEGGTFFTPQGATEDVNTPLAPFWQKKGVMWTSATVRDTRTLNYTYPELVKWSELTPQQKGTRLRSDINAVYGRSAPMAAIVPELFNNTTAALDASSRPVQTIVGQQPVGQPAAKPAAAAAPAKPAAPAAVAAGVQKVVAAAPAPVQQAAAAVASAAKSVMPGEHVEVSGVGSHAHVDDQRHYHEWIANITVEKFAAKKTFFVYIFLGDFTTDPSKWGEDPNLVGTHVVFANNIRTTGCERCRDAAEKHKLVTGTIPLTGALGDKMGAGKIAHLDPADVVPFLRTQLHWRILDQDDHEIQRKDLPGLKVTVAHSTVTAPTNIAEFPTWGDTSRQTAVTNGRDGGANDDDDD